MNTKYVLIKYTLTTFILSYALQFYVIFNGGIKAFGSSLLVALMWIPGLVSLIFRFIHKDWKDIGLKFGPKNYIAIAFLVPCIGALITGLLCHILDIRLMDLSDSAAILDKVPKILIIFLFGFFAALGEELGWRGYLVPKIYTTDIKMPTLATGLVWAIWHIPIVAFTGYYQTMGPLLVIVLYTASILCFNYFINWARLASGSMWIATLMHASHNFFFQTFWFLILFKKAGSRGDLLEKVGADVGGIPVAIYFIIVLFGHYKLKWKLSYSQ